MRSIHPCNHFRMESLIFTRAVHPSTVQAEYWQPSKSDVLLFLTWKYYYSLVAETSICFCLFCLLFSNSLFQLLQAIPASTSWAYLLCRNSMTAHQMKSMASDLQGWLREYFELIHQWILKGGRKRNLCSRTRRYWSLPYNFKIQMKCTVISKVGLSSYMG